jgi:hypothetical protein
VLRRALDAARLGNTDRLEGFRRLDRFVRQVEKRLAPEADLPKVVAHENAISALDGRSVPDDPPARKGKRQLDLFR